MFDSWLGKSFAAPDRLVYSLIFGQLLLWTLIPTLTTTSLPHDVVSEGLTWGHEWQWGYHKFPPMVSWSVNIFYGIFGKAGPYLLSQICIALTYLLTYHTAKYYVSEARAALSVMLLSGVVFFTWHSHEFNRDIAQLPIWAAAIYLFHRILDRNLTLDWMFLGLLFGVGVLTKYQVVILALTFVIYVLLIPQPRRTILSGDSIPKLLICAAASLAVLSPHLVWLNDNDYMPFHHLSETAAPDSGYSGRILGGLGFSSAQIANHLPMIAIMLLAGMFFRRPEEDPKTRAQLRESGATLLLHWLAFGPLLITITLYTIAGAGLHDMGGAPMWTLSGIVAIYWLGDRLTTARRERVYLISIAVMAGSALLFGAYSLTAARFTGKPLRTDWPGKELSQRFDAAWDRKTDCPLKIVAGDVWLAGLVSLKAHERPSVWIDGDRTISPWIDETDLLDSGTLVVWRDTGPEMLDPAYKALSKRPGFVRQPAISIDWPKKSLTDPLIVEWGVIPPQTPCQKQPELPPASPLEGN